FYHRLISQLYTRRYRVGLRVIRGYLIFSFIAVFITIFTTCTSADLTRLYPPPADICRTALLPLITTAALSSFGDILLALAPLPAILASSLRLHWFRKIRLVISFSLSLGC